MNENTTPAAPEKTVIRPNLNNYVRAKSGNGKRTQRTDDLTARTLDGKSLEQVKNGANLLGIDHAKWSHLNPGQQRMLIGNAIRHRLNATKEPLTEQALRDVFGEPAAPYDAEAAAAAAAAAKVEREKKAAEREEAKKAKEAAKAEKAAKRAEGAATTSVAETGDGLDKSDRSNVKSSKKSN